MNKRNRWIIYWIIAFLAFPPAGLLAVTLIGGGMDNALEGLAGGFIAGLVIGGGQYLALRGTSLGRPAWILATGIGLGAGVGLATALFGASTAVNDIVLRAPVTGLMLGTAQWLVMRPVVRFSLAWVPLLTVLFPVAWFVTAQVITTSVNQSFVIFGASGALLFQIVSGAALWRLFRQNIPTRATR
ncbi:MAG: hypothetical protein KME04_06615 [Pleurocapsa minor GSE-CHR-MK-17-07R]|jgi:hypothetical protein|nr:hypothetical protein [Pleurocapsa minor GSE-CHR-MK 17-07R]